jgi:protein-L-isoaspartate(D-aspartate) O-methyltransferase
MADFKEQRLNMVESQVRPSDVTDRRIVRAMGDVAREHYVPAARRSTAYMDEAVPIAPVAGGHASRHLLAPRTFAKLLHLAEIGDNAAVLAIGSGTGYSLAVIARIARQVFGVETDQALVSHAKAALLEDGVKNAEVIHGPLSDGHAPGGPYDAILVEGAAQDIPRGLLDQLKDGGRLVAIVADGPAGKAVVWKRSGKTFAARDAFDVTASALPGFQRTAAFVL